MHVDFSFVEVCTLIRSRNCLLATTPDVDIMNSGFDLVKSPRDEASLYKIKNFRQVLGGLDAVKNAKEFYLPTSTGRFHYPLTPNVNFTPEIRGPQSPP